MPQHHRSIHLFPPFKVLSAKHWAGENNGDEEKKKENNRRIVAREDKSHWSVVWQERRHLHHHIHLFFQPLWHFHLHTPIDKIKYPLPSLSHLQGNQSTLNTHSCPWVQPRQDRQSGCMQSTLVGWSVVGVTDTFHATSFPWKEKHLTNLKKNFSNLPYKQEIY